VASQGFTHELDSYTNSKRRKSSPQNINNCVKEISSRPMTAWRHAKRLAALEENDRRAAAKLARSKVNSMETAAQCRGYRTRYKKNESWSIRSVIEFPFKRVRGKKITRPCVLAEKGLSWRVDLGLDESFWRASRIHTPA